MCCFGDKSQQNPVETAFDPVETCAPPIEKSADVNRIGWLMKKENKLISSWEKVFCVLVDGILYYFNSARCDARGHGLPDSGYLGETDLAGASCKMKIDADQMHGIQITAGNGDLIHLNADSHADQKHWYDAILDEIDGANDAVFRAQGIANKGMQTWFDRKSEERREALSSLQKGLKMRKHYMAMGFHKVHDRIVKVDEKGQSIYWYDPAAPTVPGGGKEITNRVPIESIVSVQYGAETVALSTLASKSEDSLRCFSICTAEKTYDFECDSHDARNEFAGNLEKVREHAERCEVGEEVAIRKQHMEKKDKLRSSMSKSQAIMKQQNRRTAVNPNLINSSMEINNS